MEPVRRLENRPHFAPRPMFNVNPHFSGVYVITLNQLMREHLEGFIESNQQMIEDDVEISALLAALKTESHEHIPTEENGPGFLVDNAFNGIMTMKFNEGMCLLLSDFIKDVFDAARRSPGRDVMVAFMYALNDPRSREERERERYERSQHIPPPSYDTYPHSNREGYYRRKYESPRPRY